MSNCFYPNSEEAVEEDKMIQIDKNVGDLRFESLERVKFFGDGDHHWPKRNGGFLHQMNINCRI